MAASWRWVVALGSLILGCQPDVSSPEPACASPDAPPSYQGFVRAFIETRCASCHSPSGVAPFDFASYDDIIPVAENLVHAVTSGTMPPNLPRDGCRPLANVPVVSSEDIETLTRWQAAGYPEGEDCEYGAPAPPRAPPDLGPATLELTLPQPHTPEPGSGDVQLEWTLDYVFSDDTWVVASKLFPSEPSVVHHANAFVTDAEIGESVPVPAKILGAWAPGYGPFRFPDGSALFVPKGARVKLLVHYTTMSYPLAEQPPPDSTRLELWTLAPDQKPQAQAFFDPISHSDLFIPAGAPHVEASSERELLHPGAPIVGVMPHMHLLGVAFRSEIVRSDGSTACLADVPSYDFFHQSLFLFEQSAFVEVGMGDLHRMTCVFDNSPANQSVVSGHPKYPVNVGWGDASTDEMCIDALLRVAPL